MLPLRAFAVDRKLLLRDIQQPGSLQPCLRAAGLSARSACSRVCSANCVISSALSLRPDDADKCRSNAAADQRSARALLQSDGYGAYTRLADAHRAGGPVTLAACWAHLRRYFYELHVAGLSTTATWTVERMAALWRVEEGVRGSKSEIRLAARRATSAAIVAELFERWETELKRIPRKSKLAEAIRYGIRRRAAFERFLHDGRLDIDNNTVERTIRPQTRRGSLCSSFSSACKQRKRSVVGRVTRAALSGNRIPHRIRCQIGCADLERRARHNLNSGKDIRLD